MENGAQMKQVELPRYNAYGSVKAGRITQITRSGVNEQDGTAWLVFGDLCKEGEFVGELVSESFIGEHGAAIGNFYVVSDDDEEPAVMDAFVFLGQYAEERS